MRSAFELQKEAIVRDHQLDNRLNLIAVLAALGMLAFGALNGALSGLGARTEIAEVQLPRVVVQAKREAAQPLRTNPEIALCDDRAPQTLQATLPGSQMN